MKCIRIYTYIYISYINTPNIKSNQTPNANSGGDRSPGSLLDTNDDCKRVSNDLITTADVSMWNSPCGRNSDLVPSTNYRHFLYAAWHAHSTVAPRVPRTRTRNDVKKLNVSIPYQCTYSTVQLLRKTSTQPVPCFVMKFGLLSTSCVVIIFAASKFEGPFVRYFLPSVVSYTHHTSYQQLHHELPNIRHTQQQISSDGTSREQAAARSTNPCQTTAQTRDPR